MSSRPSIKGVVLQLAVEAVHRLKSAGLIDRGQLEARLHAEDLALLDRKVLPGVWYPIATPSRLLEITTYGNVREGGLEAVVDVGIRAAKRLFAHRPTRTTSRRQRTGVLATPGPPWSAWLPCSATLRSGLTMPIRSPRTRLGSKC